MASSSSTVEHSPGRNSAGCWSRSGSRSGKCGNWSGFNIAAMVIGFVLFWPLGLIALVWISLGRSIKELPGVVSDLVAKIRSVFQMGGEATSNTVFNDYQETQYDRIREIKEEIKRRADRFNTFKSEARRKADEEEFRRFMDEYPNAE